MIPSAAPQWLPFAAFNLRSNPFGERTPEDRAELAVVDAQRWLPMVARDHQSLQFIGDCGRGKTTHLLALGRLLPDSAYVYLPEDGPLPAIPRGTPLLIDEAQRLPCRVRREAFRRGVPLILGTHVDLTKVLQRYGYTVCTVQVQQMTDAQHLAAVFNRRVEAVRLDDDRPVPCVTSRDATYLYKRFGTDIRAMESYLYERVQRYAGGPSGEVQFID